MGSIDPNGTAADSGIQKGDVILEIQQVPVVDPDKASKIFSAQSDTNHHFAAVLIERGKKRLWVPIALPD